MDITLLPSSPKGKINAISSKSAAHRILLCAAFADFPTVIRCDTLNKDIEATVQCLCALGAKIEYNAPFFNVKPISSPIDGATLRCSESGSTLRFLLPIIPALGIDARFCMEGRLPERPLSPLYEELVRHGALLAPAGSNPLFVGGRLCGDEYRLRGDVSSQFISGLLFALAVSGLGGRLIIGGKTESLPYINMTVNALSLFGVQVEKSDSGYFVPSGCALRSPKSLTVEGDWSNAAFMLCMGALGKNTLTVCGLDAHSAQGDARIVNILRTFGADIAENCGEYTVVGGKPLHGIELDASQIPDLVPAVATLASLSEGTTRIYGAARLRLKESDRIASVCSMLSALGADISPTNDGMIINGVKVLRGGTVDSANDHRIAMSTAIAAAGAAEKISVKGAECVGKSYPAFWEDIKNQLGVALDT